jgi:hypothetical protein
MAVSLAWLLLVGAASADDGGWSLLLLRAKGCAFQNGGLLAPNKRAAIDDQHGRRPRVGVRSVIVTECC